MVKFVLLRGCLQEILFELWHDERISISADLCRLRYSVVAVAVLTADERKNAMVATRRCHFHHDFGFVDCHHIDSNTVTLRCTIQEVIVVHILGLNLVQEDGLIAF